MLSPFAAIQAQGWLLAYGREVGITSGFGHLIDHMATSRAVQVKSSRVDHLTNQKFGNKPPDTDLPLTDHNSVTTVFLLSGDDEKHPRKRTRQEQALRDVTNRASRSVQKGS